MPIAFRAIAGNTRAGSETGTTSLVVTKPAGTANGDVLVAVVAFANGTFNLPITPPAGWTSLGYQDGVDYTGRTQMFYKAASGEGASYSFSFDGGGQYAIAALIASYSGAAASPIDAVGSQRNAISTNETAPSVTPGAAGAMLVCCYGAEGVNASGPTSTPPAGMTERSDVSVVAQPANEYGGYLDIHVSLNDLLLASTSPTGAKTATLSAARENSGFSVLLRSAEAPPPPPPASVAGLHMVV